MKRLRILQTACALASLLMLAACTQDELTDNGGTSLPEGKYPLMLTATQDEVVASPQTRVTDQEKEEGGVKKIISSWTAGDQIQVNITGGSNDAETTCTLDASGNITAYNPPLYWKTTQSSKINAWYSNIVGQNTTSNTVSLANQSSGLAYVLKAEEKSNVNYQSGNISLDFKHQLAKVRVKVEKGTYTGNLNVTAVSVKGYTSCTVTNGAVVASGSSLSNISMKKTTYGSDTYWEANLVPGTNAMDKTITINADGKTTTCTLTSDITLTAGNVYTFTVTVNSSFITYDLSQAGAITINDNRKYILTGTGSQTVTISGGSPTVKLKGAKIQVTKQGSNPWDNTPAISITGGTPTLIIDGNDNSLTGSITLWNNADITIEGSGSSNSKLTIDANGNASAIGDGGTKSDITIRNITLDATGGNYPNQSGMPAIGAGLGQFCGNILIENCAVTAKTGDVGGSAAIGSTYVNGSPSSVGDITIKNSTVKVTIYPKYIKNSLTSGYYAYAAGIGTGFWFYNSNNTSCGKIDITSNTTIDEFIKDWSVVNANSDAKKNKKIGLGYIDSNISYTPSGICGGVYYNGNKVGDDNGYGSW